MPEMALSACKRLNLDWGIKGQTLQVVFASSSNNVFSERQASTQSSKYINCLHVAVGVRTVFVGTPLHFLKRQLAHRSFHDEDMVLSFANIWLDHVEPLLSTFILVGGSGGMNQT